MRFAVLADIHGNARALDAVLADLAARGIDRCVNLGDCLYGPFDPRPVADRLIDAGWPTVAGSEDRCLVEAADGGAASRTARFTLDQLSERHLAWLGRLPLTQQIGGVAFAFHGTPTSDTRYLLQRPCQDGTVRPILAHEVAAQLEGIDSPLILCAHDHMPRVVKLADGQTVVNPGSVGCPAHADGAPIPHVVEVGSPHARYAIVTYEDNGPPYVKLLTVPYEWDAAADDATANGFADWAHWIGTGQAV
jgi:predicted phosphodiesterase